MSRVDHSSHLPLYIQLIQHLSEEIEKGTYKEEERIPPERALAAQFGVSRITVTSAIQKMVQEGTLYRIQGKGTFVAAKKQMEHPLSVLKSFSDDMVNQGYTPGNLLIECSLIIPPERVKNGLKLSQEEKTWKIKRVRYADSEPMAIQTAYIPERLCPSLDAQTIQKGSLYQILQQEYSMKMDEAEETYRVVYIRKEEEAALLNVPIESAALSCTRISFLDTKERFEFTESILRGDRYVLSVRMKA
ncbi:GntR family transcriptional regulator [Aneurinibacillus tyrosinisolvens]|uniref:GntR family transcriptional regulator n=1 Tax=Aneurinibacillus tyrosinisolvens TaxID=1443435 RepID=UPI00063F30EF|nr:GntR family transcriptional regulator [Aneurinibacillus tyrosinisolvens]